MCLMPYATNKGADQPPHPRSPISAFIVHCLDKVMSLVSVTKFSSLMLASVAEQASLSLTWSETPEDTFSHGVARIYVVCWRTVTHTCVGKRGKELKPNVGRNHAQVLIKFRIDSWMNKIIQIELKIKIFWGNKKAKTLLYTWSKASEEHRNGWCESYLVAESGDRLYYLIPFHLIRLSLSFHK